MLERGMKLDEPDSMLPLGNLCADHFGDEGTAESAYRAGAALGDAHAHHNLGVLLEGRGDRDGAGMHYRLAAEAGDALAANALRRLLDETP